MRAARRYAAAYHRLAALANLALVASVIGSALLGFFLLTDLLVDASHEAGSHVVSCP